MRLTPCWASQAEEILELAGSRVGLGVHLGCGRQEAAALTAELAAASRMLVHGLAVDDASLERTRQAIVEENFGDRPAPKSCRSIRCPTFAI